MTPQEIFDTAWKAVTKQGRPSISPAGGQCVYLASDGARCGAGHLMNDDEIAAYGDEGGTISSIIRADRRRGDGRILRPFFAGHADLIKKIQWAHDDASQGYTAFVPAFHRNMKRIAKEHGLEVPNDAS